jgi:hypothetical protein
MLANHSVGSMRLTSFLCAFALLSVAGCSRASRAETGPSLERDPVEGLWVHQETPTGHREAMTLTTHGYGVQGTGVYTTERGLQGTTTITGSKRRGVITLEIVRDTGIRDRWTGRVARGRLRGEMVFDDPPGHRMFDFDRPGAVPRHP